MGVSTRNPLPATACIVHVVRYGETRHGGECLHWTAFKRQDGSVIHHQGDDDYCKSVALKITSGAVQRHERYEGLAYASVQAVNGQGATVYEDPSCDYEHHAIIVLSAQPREGESSERFQETVRDVWRQFTYHRDPTPALPRWTGPRLCT